MREIKFLKNIIIAHRGYFDNIKVPENSIKSFQKAIENNLAIELDLQLLKDNSIIVFHDYNLKRLTGIDKELKDITYLNISKLHLLNTNESIPLFKDVLTIINGKVPIIIELKTNSKVLVDKVMELLKNYKGKYCIKSFNPILIFYLKNHYPSVIRGLIISDYKKSFIKKLIYKAIPFTKILKLDFISYDIRSLPFKKNKIIVLGWTIRANSDFERAKLYCDSFICEKIVNELKKTIK